MIKEIKIEELNDEFFNLYYEGFLYHYNNRKDLFKKRTIDELKEYLYNQMENGLKIIGYFKNNKLIGYISYEIKEKVTNYLWIDEFVITETERGNGYGTLLLNEISRISDLEKVKRLELNCYCFNENAIKLYKKLGYKEQRIIFEKEV